MQNTQYGLACKANQIVLTVKNITDLKANDPGMFGTLQAFLQSEKIDLRVINSKGILLGTFEQYFRVSDGKVRTRLVKSDTYNKTIWEIYKQHKESYPMKDVDQESYKEQIKIYLKIGMSKFDAEREAEDILPGERADWRTYFRMVKIYWENLLEI